MNRTYAARLLRAARGRIDAPGGIDADAIEWAFAAMPDRRAAQRLRIRQSIHELDYGAADSVIAQCLLQRPNDPALQTLRAESLVGQGRLEAADEEMQSVLAVRPEHVSTLRFAADIANKLGAHRRAGELLARAVQRRRNDESLRQELARSLVLAGDADAAERALWHTYSTPPLLAAQILRGQGRLVDAAEALEAAVAATADPAEEELLELIDLLEALGRPPRIGQVLQRIAGHQEHAMIRAGLVWLSLGEFSTAVSSLTPLLRTARSRPSVATLLVVACVFLNRPRRARAVLARSGVTLDELDRPLLLEAWRRGVFGQTIQAQAQPMAGDPSTSMLRPMLESAVDVLEMELRRSGELSDERRIKLEVHLATCLRALDRGGEPTLPRSPRRPRRPIEATRPADHTHQSRAAA